MSLPKKTSTVSNFKAGVTNSPADGGLYWLQNVDLEAAPPAVVVANRLFKETDSTATTKLGSVSYGVVFEGTNYIANAAGNILKLSGTTWTSAYDIATGSCLGLYGDSQLNNSTENGFLYWASNNNAGRYDIVGGVWTPLWQAFSVSNDSNPCPIEKFQKFICYGNRRYLAVWDAGATSWVLS